MRTNVTRQFRSRERKCMGTKRPGTDSGVYGDLFLATSLHRRRKGPGAQPPKNGVGGRHHALCLPNSDTSGP